MMCSLIIYALLTLRAFASPHVHNANHIFNAIHSSMRQWGSSLNHNGMSFFLATVPAGTPLYHGTSSEDFVKGIEWLAFEAEHASIFAWPERAPPDKHRPASELALPQRDEQVQKLLGIATLDEDAAYGFLHTYAPKHDLHLLYIDGLSAGKTGNGTLDTQDLLLLNASWPGLRGPMGGEYTRATGLCNLSSTVWDGRIDGILRMEGGFEIILCDFERHLERKDMISINHKESDINTILGGWTYIKAVVARYHGIGSSRVALDYSDFVSVFSYPEVGDLFQNDVQSDYAMPRLQNVKSSDLDLIRDDITAMILRKNWDEHPKENWQQTADLIVKRYSKPLHYLHTNEEVRRNASMLVEYLGSLLRPFIDDRDRNSTLETHRCVAQFVPDLHLLEKPLSSLAHRTIHDTTHHICDTLIATLCISSAPANQASRAIKAIDDLVSYLQWTTWKECGTCPDEEVCFIPIWPLGAHDDHAHPTCRNQASARERQGYWGRQHGPWLSTGRNAQMNHNDS